MLSIVLRLSVNRSAMSNSFQLHGLQPARLLCLWNYPGKNTGVGCPSLLQGIIPIHIHKQIRASKDHFILFYGIDIYICDTYYM